MEETQFLKQLASLLKENNESLETGGKRFNLFELLDRKRDEVKTHSKLIGELLNHRGKHDKGDVFFKLFINLLLECRRKDELWCNACIPEVKEIVEYNVELEKYIGKVREESGGILDIVISSRDFTICIENKIDAIDQPNQLKRYSSFLKRRKHNTILIYLTLDGEDSQESNLVRGKDYFCLSYKVDVVNWLKKCINSISNREDSFLRISISQYLSLVKEITNQTQSDMIQEEIHQEILSNLLISDRIVSEFDLALRTISEEVRGKVINSLRKEISEGEIDSVDTGNRYSSIFISLPNSHEKIGIESFNGNGHEGGALFYGKLDFNRTGNSHSYKYGIWHRNTIAILWTRQDLLEKYQAYSRGDDNLKNQIIEEIVTPLKELYFQESGEFVRGTT